MSDLYIPKKEWSGMELLEKIINLEDRISREDD
jgi:hypothetical protein